MPGFKPRLLLATSNLNKVQEIKSILKGLEIEILTLKNFSNLPEVRETGKSFRINALQKAKFYAQELKIITLADDSGLCIKYLNDFPGIYSARFGGEGASYQIKNSLLLEMMKEVPWEKRQAKFICCAALVTPRGDNWVRQGSLSGYIAYQAKGGHGFGYDPIFYLPKYKQNLAELTEEVKNSISHRYKAMLRIGKVLNNPELLIS
jgi:XTP/dITP diphosphohydrolase